MSTSLTAVQQIEFDALVKAEYQSLGFLLRDTVRVRRDVIGASVSFRKVMEFGVGAVVPGRDPSIALLPRDDSVSLRPQVAPAGLLQVDDGGGAGIDVGDLVDDGNVQSSWRPSSP